MWSLPAISHASLIQTYIEALNLTAITVVGAGRQCRVITGEPAPGEPVAARYLFKPSHAELVLATIGPEGLSGKPASALVDAIERAAANPSGRRIKRQRSSGPRPGIRSTRSSSGSRWRVYRAS
jgi:hypothetical protein